MAKYAAIFFCFCCGICFRGAQAAAHIGFRERGRVLVALLCKKEQDGEKIWRI